MHRFGYVGSNRWCREHMPEVSKKWSLSHLADVGLTELGIGRESVTSMRRSRSWRSRADLGRSVPTAGSARFRNIRLHRIEQKTVLAILVHSTALWGRIRPCCRGTPLSDLGSATQANKWWSAKWRRMEMALVSSRRQSIDGTLCLRGAERRDRTWTPRAPARDALARRLGTRGGGRGVRGPGALGQGARSLRCTLPHAWHCGPAMVGTGSDCDALEQAPELGPATRAS